jgi:prepilin-type N-terminal cleavage/methylation domain-containing protein
MRSHARAGFTLVELMVAMALTMFIMVILSQAFVIALDTFVGLKAIGDMQANLRVATTLMRDDLSQDHFEGKLRLSDVTEMGAPRIVVQRPRAGFFSVLQGTAPVDATAGNPKPGPYVREGIDANGFPSYRAVNHVLYMTVKRKGNRPQDYFSAALPNSPAVATFFSNQSAYTMNPAIDLPAATYADPYDPAKATALYNSQWAEVMYYLVQTGSTEEPNNPGSTLGIPLYSLYRAQFVMVNDGTQLAGKISNGNWPTFQGLSCNPVSGGSLEFYSPADAAQRKRMFPSLTTPPLSAGDPKLFKNGVRETLVLQNVTSFQIQVMPLGGTSFGDVSGNIYDTSLPTTTFGLSGIQVTLRVFEYKTRQTRQVSIIQDL